MLEVFESKSENMPMNGVQSVERAFDLLECLARSPQWVGISELSAATGQPIGTVHRLLKTLMLREYVVRDKRMRRYALGPAVRMLATPDLQMPNWTEIAAPFLRKLVEVSNETSNLAVMERDKAIYVAQVQSLRMIRVFTEIGNRVPLHSTGCGKVLLAYQPDDIIASIMIGSGLPAYTDKTITDPKQFRQELDAVRKYGYAVDNGEQEEEVFCVAVPVYASRSKVIAAMSISGPANRLDSERIQILLPHLKRISSDLSATLTTPREIPRLANQ
ncbi:MAG: allantoin degradation transcriptional regulator AllR [Ktedonobacteraceae bacterium]